MPHRGARMVEQVLEKRHGQRRGQGRSATSASWSSIDARGDGGPMFKRLMPRARGMAYLIRRRTAHINVGLADLASWSRRGARGRSSRRRDRRTERSRCRLANRPERGNETRVDDQRHDTIRGRLKSWAKKFDRPGSAWESWKTGGAAGTLPSTNSPTCWSRISRSAPSSRRNTASPGSPRSRSSGPATR